MQIRSLLSVAFLMVVAGAHPLAAQGPTVVAAQSALGRCTYETCAIRLDRSFVGGRRINSGLEGVSVPMGFVGGGLVRAVDAVPRALDEASRGRRNAIKATVVGVIAGLALAYSLEGARGDPLLWNDAQVFGGILAAGAATVVTVQQSIYAERHFSRAIWLYNRELPR